MHEQKNIYYRIVRKPGTGQTKIKITEIEQAALNSVINLVDRTNSVDLVTLMNYRITDECLSIF